MKHRGFILKLWKGKRRRLLIICALAMLCLSQATLAQSGRRQGETDTAQPTVTVEATTEREVKPPANKLAPVASLLVGGDRFGSSLYILPGYVDEAVESCLQRLSKSPSLAVKGNGNMTRKDAVDLAKKQKDAHVLWLEIKVEEDGSDSLSIGYSILTPQTAKVMASGRVYLGSTRVGNGRVGVGVPSISGRLPLEYQLQEGGRSVADRVMKKFHVALPD